MTDFFYNNALFNASFKSALFLSAPYIDANTINIEYPLGGSPLEADDNRAPQLALSPDDGRRLRNLEYAYWMWMMLMVVWGDRFGRDNGLIPSSGAATEGVTHGWLVEEQSA